MKILKEGSGKEDRVKFLQEATIMGQFKHPNVVKIHGIVVEDDPVRKVLATTQPIIRVCEWERKILANFRLLLQVTDYSFVNCTSYGIGLEYNNNSTY